MRTIQQEKQRLKDKKESQTKKSTRDQSPPAKTKSYENCQLLFKSRKKNKQQSQNHQQKPFIKHQKRNNQNDQTDVEMQFHEHVKWEVEQQHQKLQVETSIKKQQTKSYHYQEDVVFQSRSQQQKREIKKKQELLKSDDEDHLSKSNYIKNSNRSLTKTESRILSQQIPKPQLKYKSQSQPKPLSKLQIKHKQHIEQIFKTKFPQNVMHRVYPLEEKPLINNHIKSKKQQPSYQPIQNNKEKYQQQPIWTRAQHRILEVNMKSIAVTIIDDKIREVNYGKEEKDKLTFDIDFDQVPDDKKLKQKYLQLKCLLRYRSLNSILRQLKQFIDSCYEHNQLLGLNYVFNQQDFLEMLKIKPEDFYQMAMEKFIKLINIFTGQYQQASRENKQRLEKMLYNEKQKRDNALKKDKDINYMLGYQGIFKSWGKILNKRCYLESRKKNFQGWSKQKRQRSQNKNNQDVQI